VVRGEAEVTRLNAIILAFTISFLGGLTSCKPDLQLGPYTVAECEHVHDKRGAHALLTTHIHAKGVRATVEICNSSEHTIQVRPKALPRVDRKSKNPVMWQPLFEFEVGARTAQYKGSFNKGIIGEDEAGPTLRKGEKLCFNLELTDHFTLQRGVSYKIRYSSLGTSEGELDSNSEWFEFK
jgi:hypothetical protein